MSCTSLQGYIMGCTAKLQPLAIFNSTIKLFSITASIFKFNLYNNGMSYPSQILCIKFFHTHLNSPHWIPSRAGIGGLSYLGEGHILGTLHPARLGPNLFFVGEEEESGWGHCYTAPLSMVGVRRTLGLSLEGRSAQIPSTLKWLSKSH